MEWVGNGGKNQITHTLNFFLRIYLALPASLFDYREQYARTLTIQ
jgi:hypothetical protein